MNFLDKVISYFSPGTGLKRVHYRAVLAGYDAAKPSKHNRRKIDKSSIDSQVTRGAETIRGLARHGQQNHDLVAGAIRHLIDSVIGPDGIGIEPTPRNFDDTINEEYAKALRSAWVDWCLKPEVTQRFHWNKACRMVFEAWMRDGEIFAQRLSGPVNGLDHGTLVPYSIELIDVDFCPMDYHDPEKNIYQSIERNQWGKPVAFWFYKNHPHSDFPSVLPTKNDLKRVDANRIHHIANINRVGQMRGISIFASVLDRLDDVRDYESSERIAARIAAALTAFVKKGGPDNFREDDQKDPKERLLNLQPGMIIDGLRPGEEIGIISSDRPNTNLLGFRSGQLRAVAAGIGASYSSLAKDYSGTYSSQRQELLEAYIRYAVLADDFVRDWVQPNYKDFVSVAHLSGAVPRPNEVDPAKADEAVFVAQAMPWIDPLKEAAAIHQMVLDGFMSEVQAIRRRGGSPQEVLDQIARFRVLAKQKGLVFASNAAHQTIFNANAANAENPEKEEEEKQEE